MSKNKKSDNNDLDKLSQQILDNFSIEIFGKTYDLLQIAEIEKLNRYIYDLNHPKWKSVYIDNKPTNYEVSNIGQARNIVTNCTLKLQVKNKYYQFNVCMGAKNYWRSVHRLVAEAFIPNPENKPCVNHINGNKLCNWVENLEWVTYQENTDHAIRTGLWNNFGDDNSETKYSDKKVNELCQIIQDNPDMLFDEISKMTGLSRRFVNDVAKGRSRTHISSHYKFPKYPLWNFNSKDQIEEVCELLMDPLLSYTDIAKKVGVSHRTVGEIYRRHQWLDISSKYDFPPRPRGMSKSCLKRLIISDSDK